MIREKEICGKYDFLMHDHTIVFDKFLMQIKTIPKEEWIFILLDIYACANINVELFKIYPKGALRLEMKDDREERIKYNLQNLEPYMDMCGNVTVYRGVGESMANEDNAISYTISRSVAEWFANRKRLCGDKNVKVIKRWLI